MRRAIYQRPPPLLSHMHLHLLTEKAIYLEGPSKKRMTGTHILISLAPISEITYSLQGAGSNHNSFRYICCRKLTLENCTRIVVFVPSCSVYNDAQQLASSYVAFGIFVILILSGSTRYIYQGRQSSTKANLPSM